MSRRIIDLTQSAEEVARDIATRSAAAHASTVGVLIRGQHSIGVLYFDHETLPLMSASDRCVTSRVPYGGGMNPHLAAGLRIVAQLEADVVS